MKPISLELMWIETIEQNEYAEFERQKRNAWEKGEPQFERLWGIGGIYEIILRQKQEARRAASKLDVSKDEIIKARKEGLSRGNSI